MTNIPKYPTGNKRDLESMKAAQVRRGADAAVYSAIAWADGLLTFLLDCLHGVNVSRAASGGSSEQWAAWMYPIYSVWMWGPMILLALILAITARKGPRQGLSITIMVLSAIFPVLAVLILIVESLIFG